MTDGREVDQEAAVLVGVAALEDLRAEVDAAGLPRPPVPSVLVPLLRRESAWRWSTYDHPTSPYDHLADLHAAVLGVEDGLVVAHAGHGRQSWALHYVLTLGPASVVLQVPWGGVVADSAAPEVMRRLYDDTRKLLSLLAGRIEEGTLGARRVVVGWSGWHGEHLVVVDGAGATWFDGQSFEAVFEALSGP